MREKIEFIGRNYSEEEKSSASGAINKWEDEAARPIEGELEKSPEQKELIKKLRELLEKELQSLGVEDLDIIGEENIHFLEESLFEKNFPNSKNSANYWSSTRSIFLNLGIADTKAKQISTLLHELVHSVSKQKFYTDDQKNITEARVGYRVHSDWKEEGRTNRLKGFNEVMTDYTVYKILLTNLETLKDLEIEEKDVRGPIYTYLAPYQTIVDSIGRKIAEDKKISYLEAFNKLERGQFENTLLALKDIDRLFGEGSLQILSYLAEFKDEKRVEVDKAIRKYFEEEDAGERKILGDQIRLMVAS